MKQGKGLASVWCIIFHVRPISTNVVAWIKFVLFVVTTEIHWENLEFVGYNCRLCGRVFNELVCTRSVVLISVCRPMVNWPKHWYIQLLPLTECLFYFCYSVSLLLARFLISVTVKESVSVVIHPRLIKFRVQVAEHTRSYHPWAKKETIKSWNKEKRNCCFFTAWLFVFFPFLFVTFLQMWEGKIHKQGCCVQEHPGWWRVDVRTKMK